MATLGNKAATQHVSLQKQTITGNGGTSYTLQQSVGSALDVAVFINNTRQEPTTAYSASGTTLTMTGAVNSSDHFYVIFLGKSIVTTGLPVDAVGTANINANAVTTAKLHDDAVTSAKLPAGSVLQVKYYQLTTMVNETYGTANTNQAITNFTVNITPQSTNSIIKLEANIMYESVNRVWSTMWFFFRDSTKLANTQASPGNRLTGVSPGLSSLDSNDDSTPDMATLTYFDAPATTSQIAYKLGVISRTNNIFYINRTITDTDTDSYDRGVSFISATEIAG